jgi:hypothetical protein
VLPAAICTRDRAYLGKENEDFVGQLAENVRGKNHVAPAAYVRRAELEFF